MKLSSMLILSISWSNIVGEINLHMPTTLLSCYPLHRLSGRFLIGLKWLQIIVMSWNSYLEEYIIKKKTTLFGTVSISAAINLVDNGHRSNI